MMARFRNFYSLKKVKTWFKKAQWVSNRCKDLFKQKEYFGVMGTLILLFVFSECIVHYFSVTSQVRSSKLAKHSKYAPADGNRYDGIYKVR